MPTYPTPTPIDLAVTVHVGRVEVSATDRTDTVVTVSPTNPDKAGDRRGAEGTTVALDGQRLVVTTRKPRFSLTGGNDESVDVLVELPTGSRLTADVSVGDVRTTGRLGATRIKSATGSVHVDATGELWLRAGHGTASVASADGAAEIIADHGQIRVGTITGDATLRASHGSITVGQSGGDLQARLSHGDLDIGTALGSVEAKTAYGVITLGEVRSGSIEVESAFGEITIGVRPGVPAWLDLSTKRGRVRNELGGDQDPGPSEQAVAVRTRTQFGDVTVRHAR